MVSADEDDQQVLSEDEMSENESVEGSDEEDDVEIYEGRYSFEKPLSSMNLMIVYRSVCPLGNHRRLWGVFFQARRRLAYPGSI